MPCPSRSFTVAHSKPEPGWMARPTAFRKPHAKRVYPLPSGAKRKIAAARRKIEDIARLPAGDDFRGPSSPKKIGPPAQEMIREIVAPRYSTKHRANGFGIARDVDRGRIRQRIQHESGGAGERRLPACRSGQLAGCIKSAS